MAVQAARSVGNHEGRTGDLTGTTNPQTTTVHDEFLPVANFNIVPAIINAEIGRAHV